MMSGWEKSRAEYPITMGRLFGGGEWINNARTSAILRLIASQFHSRITVKRDGESANIENTLAFMRFGKNSLFMGDEVTIAAEGVDAEEAASFMASVMSGEMDDFDYMSSRRLQERIRHHAESRTSSREVDQ